MIAVFLGTGAGVPTRARNVSSWALRLDELGEVWLFDCGEGTQHQIQKAQLRGGRIRRIFITHLHGDHIFGLPGLLTSLSMYGATGPIDVYGPDGLERFVTAAIDTSRSYLNYELAIHVIDEAGPVLDEAAVSVRTAPLNHRVPAFGYRVEEPNRPGRFDAAAAAALGIDRGPDLGRLTRGETIETADGRRIDGSALIGPARPGRSVAYCSDTAYCANSVELAHNASMLIHEATFSAALEDRAAQWGHSTSVTAARVAAEADAEALVLTHFSGRYQRDSLVTVDDLVAEARAVFPNTVAATDLAVMAINPR